MNMDVNREGHIVTAGGKTTAPQCDQNFTVGNALRFISFAYLVLADGRVVIHSALCDAGDERYEDFLYEIVERHEAMKVAVSMVDDAIDYLEEIGSPLDLEQSATAEDFLEKLQQELKFGLH